LGALSLSSLSLPRGAGEKKKASAAIRQFVVVRQPHLRSVASTRGNVISTAS
jgi:hypothetical protein